MSAPATGIAAVRGAIQVAANRADLIHEATARLLRELLAANALTPDQIVSAVFTATPDLDADFPAHAARRLGWTDVPLLGAVEVAVPGALPRVVRVLLTVQGVVAGARLVPAYLDGAVALRPDLARGAAAKRTDASSAAGSIASAMDGAAGAPADSSSGAAGAPASAPSTDVPPARRHAIAIVGLGQIGGSIGLALASHAWERTGFDADSATLAAALAAGAIDRACASLAEACAEAELAVIAVPADALAAVVDDVAAALPRGAALMDTGSARAGVTDALARAAARGLAAVGGHPLAGTAGRGFAAARADLLSGARFVLLPVAGAPVPALAAALVRDVGAVALDAEPAAHDAALARTSHLPYVLACALASTGAAAHERGLSGPSFRDMTRLAASDPRMAEGYCRANAREVASAWVELRAEVERRVAALLPDSAGNGSNAA